MSLTTEITGYLDACPCGVLVIDNTGSVAWVNPALLNLLGVEADALLGKSTETLADSPYAELLDASGVLQLSDHDRARWVACSGFSVSNPLANGSTIRFYQEITNQVLLQRENDQLRQQVEELTITDQLTGLANQRALTHALNVQVTRSRRYQNPLCLAALELNAEGVDNSSIDDDTILSTSRYLRDRLRWVDTIGRWDHNQFFVLLPETRQSEGIDLMEKIVADFPANAGVANTIQLNFGLAEWQKGADSQKLMRMAANALTHTSAETA